MNRPHDTSHEDSLRALLTGELEATSPEASALLRDCAECGERWEALRNAVDRLDAAGESERRTLSELAPHERDGDAGWIRASLDRLVEEHPHASEPSGSPGRSRDAAEPPGPTSSEPGTPTSTSRRVLRLAAAAAVLLVIAFLVRLGRDTGPVEPAPPPVWLGPEDGLRLLSPLGVVEGFERFQWERELESGESFELAIYDADEGDSGEALFLIELSENRWTPTPEERERLPARIVWEVTHLDAFGIVQAAERATASSSD